MRRGGTVAEARVNGRGSRRLTAACAALAVSCGEPATPEEVLTVTTTLTASFDGLEFPRLRLAVAASGSSSLGHAVEVTAISVNGVVITAPVELVEGEHRLCATAASASGKTETACRDAVVTWPRLSGRGVRWDAAGGGVPRNLRIVIDGADSMAVDPADGSFLEPSLRALGGNMMTFFAADDVAPAIVRSEAWRPVNAVLLPATIVIPPCSIYGDMEVALDLDKAYRRSSATNTSYFDRTNAASNTGRFVVASWNVASIPVALSDTGAPEKRFTAADSAEVFMALDMMTAYFCQGFHRTDVTDALARGIVVHKDPAFSAFGAHGMAVPSTRGDYERASVVVRRLSPEDPAARDTTRRTLMHEFLHVLGFGHTCSWPSVMTTGTLCAPELRSLVPSPEDVAHYFAMQWAREGERSVLTLFSLANAFAADQVARGLPEPTVRPYFSKP